MAGKIIEGPPLSIVIKKRTLGEFFFDLADTHATKVCQIDSETGEQETFASVKKRSVRTALELIKRGATSNDTIAFCCNNILDNCIALIATAFLSAKIASLDPTLSVRDIKHLLNLIKPKLLFVDNESLDLIERSLNDGKIVAEIVIFGESTKYATFNSFLQPSKDEDSFKPIIVDSNETATIFFSSGTTGLPKGICMNHNNLLFHVNRLANTKRESTAILHFASFYWISSSILFLNAFAAGDHRVLYRNFDVEKTFRFFEKYKVKLSMASPKIAYSLATFDKADKYDLSHFKLFLVSGGRTSDKQLREIKKTFKDTIVCCPYGITEAAVVTTFYHITDRNLIESKSRSCGQVSPGVAVKVVDLDTEEVLGPNQKGEVRCKSPGVMCGYLNLDPTVGFDKDGFFKTGDIGYYDDDGYFYVVERQKEIFKYQGFHIVPTFLEMTLLEHPAIADACVFGITMPDHEEDGEYPTACVVLKPNQHVQVDEIIEFVNGRVCDRERLRGGVKIVDSIPKTPTGKTKRKVVRDEFIKNMNGK